VKVLLANVSLANGGLERQLLLLARNLPASWDVRLWTAEGGPFASVVREAGIPWRCRERRLRFDPLPAVDLWRTVRGWRPDVVHAWHALPSAAAAPVCRALGIPLIDGSIRMGSVPQELGRPRRGIMRWADLVVANSRAGLEAWRVPAAKGRVIYNAFDAVRLSAVPEARRAPGGDGRCGVVMAARMAEPKDFRTLIEAARLLEGESPGGWRFSLVGDGPDRAELVSAAGDLVARGAVRFVDGGLEAAGEILSADIGVLSTDPAILAEGCSNALLEYMACGLPVVSTDSGGCGELVREGVEGYLVAPRDPRALARRLADLQADRGLRERMGSAGRSRVGTDFTIERMASEYVSAYEEVVRLGARHRSGRPAD
jgi:glycosyltransferase involved in cell wall biosynthesis